MARGGGHPLCAGQSRAKVRIVRYTVAGTIALGLLLGAVNPGCSTDSELRGLAQSCTLNSDCVEGLVCLTNRCHAVCKESRDCQNGARCIQSPAGSVCQLPEEVPDSRAGDGGGSPGGRPGT